MPTLSDVDIKQVRGHWECHINGDFFCTGDTLDEVLEEICSTYGPRTEEGL